MIKQMNNKDRSLQNSMVPRANPGFQSQSRTTKNPSMLLSLVAAVFRSTMALIALGITLLAFPVQLWTPILSGMSLLMMVHGVTAIWKHGRTHPQHRFLTKPLIWFYPISTGIIFLMVFALGNELFSF